MARAPAPRSSADYQSAQGPHRSFSPGHSSPGYSRAYPECRRDGKFAKTPAACCPGRAATIHRAATPANPPADSPAPRTPLIKISTAAARASVAIGLSFLYLAWPAARGGRFLTPDGVTGGGQKSSLRQRRIIQSPRDLTRAIIFRRAQYWLRQPAHLPRLRRD